MTMTTIMAAAAVALLAGLLCAASRESLRGTLLTKPLLSALFVATAWTAPHRDPLYFGLVTAGLVLCLAGDVFLIFTRSANLFLAGLVSFLLGHVLYGTAFFAVSSPGAWTAAAAVVLLAVGTAVFSWMKPHLGKMKVPVTAYIIVITLMVVTAATLAGDGRHPFAGRILAFVGAVLFYASDIFVARHRFVRKEFLNRLIGLPLYYAGQFMIAASVRFF